MTDLGERVVGVTAESQRERGSREVGLRVVSEHEDRGDRTREFDSKRKRQTHCKNDP